MATLSSVIKPRPDLSGNGSNISIADGKQAEWPRPTYARSSAGPTTLSPCISGRNCSVELVLMNERLRKRVKKVRITPSTFFFSCFITLWREQLVGNRGDTKGIATKSQRGKKTETGGSDPI